MDIDRIRYFHVFAETGTLVKASEVLHISQPALSKALKLLELEIGVKLLESEGRGLKLTSAGITLKNETRPLLSQWLQIAEKIKIGETKVPTRIGTFEVFSTYFLKRLTHFIKLESLELHEIGPGKLEQAINENKVDIGITYMPIPTAGINFVEVTKIKMGIFGIKKMQNHVFSELPFAVPLSPVEGTPTKIVGLDGWPDHKLKRQINFRVSMMESALELCRQGLCIAYLPSFVVELHNQTMQPEFQLHELPSPLPTKERLQAVYLIQKNQTVESKLYRQIAKSLRVLK